MGLRKWIVLNSSTFSTEFAMIISWYMHKLDFQTSQNMSTTYPGTQEVHNVWGCYCLFNYICLFIYLYTYLFICLSCAQVNPVSKDLQNISHHLYSSINWTLPSEWLTRISLRHILKYRTSGLCHDSTTTSRIGRGQVTENQTEI